MKKPVRIDLIDDDAPVLDALGLFLERRGFDVERFGRASDYVKVAPGRESDCIVADIRMPGLSGMDLQRRLTRAGVTTPLILITGFADVGVAVAAMKAGAFDFLEKPVDERRLVASIKQALHHAEELQAEQDADQHAMSLFDSLSERERDVMSRAALGRTSREIAAELGISPRTVEIHRASVMEKTGSASLADLVRLYLRVEAVQAQRRG